MTNNGIAFDFGMRAHTAKLRHMHKAVFKDRFGDESGPFCHQVQQRELGLHIGRECRMRRGTYVNSLRTFAMHIQANPVFADFDVRSSVTQFRQHGVESIWLRVTADNFAARNRRRHQESTGFDTIR